MERDPVIERLVRWGEEQAAVRAMVLTSTRAVPGAPVDALSDYDVVVVAAAIRPFHEDRSWIGDFGEVLVTYWDSIYGEELYGLEQFGNVIQYADGLKIDFTLCLVELVERMGAEGKLPAEWDGGYRVLLDKDGLTVGLPEPTYGAYIPARPDEATYRRVIEEFFSDAPYIAKCLQRGELLPLKWALDYDMIYVYLRPMLEWRAQVAHGWQAKVGALGKGLWRWLPADMWAELAGCYVGAGTAENWEALLRTMALYRRAAVEVGEALGYVYPYELDRRVVAFVEAMRRGEEGGD